MSGVGKCLRLSQATDRCINNAVGLKLPSDTSESWQTETFLMSVPGHWNIWLILRKLINWPAKGLNL